MNFFQAQDKARQRTGALLLLFVLAVVGMIAMAYVAVHIAVHQESLSARSPEAYRIDPQILQGITIAMLTVITVGTLYKLLALRNGSAVAQALGGRRINPETATGQQRQLLNIVEEMAVASGAPMPQVYLMPDEGINAFAAGTSPANAVIGVTQGALEHFTRDQMQGVVAHEFSHILNGDMRLNLRLVGIINGIMLIGYLGYFLVRSSMYSRSRESGGIVALGFFLIVLGFIGTFSGSLIKAAVSRQREFLADASAVQFTRNPDGIAGALQSIGQHSGRLSGSHAVEYSHMFFANAIASKLASPFATHPPLAMRIKRIMPQWDGRATIGRQRRPEPQAEAAPAAGAAGTDLFGGALDRITGQAGMITAAALQMARAQRKSLPESVHKATEDPYTARALIYAMLLERSHDGFRKQQLDHLEQHADTGVHDLVLRLADDVAALPRGVLLPLVQISMPALRELSPQQSALFQANLQKLIHLDGNLHLFEWCLEAVVTHNLLECEGKRKRPGKATSADLAYALSMLAQVGNEDGAEQAFQRASQTLKANLQFQAGDFVSDRMFAAAQRIAALAPRKKEAFVRAAVACVMHDGKVTADEAALLRTFIAILDCPLPAAAD